MRSCPKSQTTRGAAVVHTLNLTEEAEAGRSLKLNEFQDSQKYPQRNPVSKKTTNKTKLKTQQQQNTFKADCQFDFFLFPISCLGHVCLT